MLCQDCQATSREGSDQQPLEQPVEVHVEGQAEGIGHGDARGVTQLDVDGGSGARPRARQLQARGVQFQV